MQRGRESLHRIVVGVMFLAVGATAVIAHHSFAVFDHSQTVTVTGTVTRYQWTNPHGFLEVDYRAADGSTKHYTIELTSINMLSRAGLDLPIREGRRDGEGHGGAAPQR